MELVSIIIPCYNEEKYIEETINSALKQTYNNLEIIIVDDGSKDNSKEVIERISKKDERVRYIFQKNSGVSVARNNGIQAAKGSIIAFLDSDDVWLSDKLKKQMEILKNEKVDACYCGFNNWYFNENKFNKKKMKFSKDNMVELYVKEKCWPQTSTWIIKKTIIEENNIFFNENCSWGEDSEFFIKIIALSKISYVSEYLVNYRIREGSLSSKNEISYEAIKMWNRLKKWIFENNICNKKELCKSIDEYQIKRIYVDNFFREIRTNGDYRNFYEEKVNITTNFRPKFNLNDLKILIKIIYIKLKNKQ